MEIPEIVKRHVLINCGRMPETQEEVDEYLDLITHAKEYQEAVLLTKKLGLKAMRRWGFKTPEEIKSEGKKLFTKKK